MTCTKTGAHILIKPYNEYVYGDAFEISVIDEKLFMELAYNDFLSGIADVAYFRIVQRGFKPLAPTLHYTVHNYVDWWDKDGPISTLITKNFTNHGYNGVTL